MAEPAGGILLPIGILPPGAAEPAAGAPGGAPLIIGIGGGVEGAVDAVELPDEPPPQPTNVKTTRPTIANKRFIAPPLFYVLMAMNADVEVPRSESYHRQPCQWVIMAVWRPPVEQESRISRCTPA
jgi:hypothetical protein